MSPKCMKMFSALQFPHVLFAPCAHVNVKGRMRNSSCLGRLWLEIGASYSNWLIWSDVELTGGNLSVDETGESRGSLHPNLAHILNEVLENELWMEMHSEKRGDNNTIYKNNPLGQCPYNVLWLCTEKSLQFLRSDCFHLTLIFV